MASKDATNIRYTLISSHWAYAGTITTREVRHLKWCNYTAKKCECVAKTLRRKLNVCYTDRFGKRGVNADV